MRREVKIVDDDENHQVAQTNCRQVGRMSKVCYDNVHFLDLD
jgi:hypothetical protein